MLMPIASLRHMARCFINEGDFCSSLCGLLGHKSARVTSQKWCPVGLPCILHGHRIGAPKSPLVSLVGQVFCMGHQVFCMGAKSGFDELAPPPSKKMRKRLGFQIAQQLHNGPKRGCLFEVCWRSVSICCLHRFFHTEHKYTHVENPCKSFCHRPPTDLQQTPPLCWTILC